MRKILMILTSHRLDCFKLTMDFLFATDSLRPFERVVLMLNGVVGRHLRYVRQLLETHPEIPWDTIAGPRGKGPLVANLQNECVRRYPESLYFKLDEDLFVSPGWVEKMHRAYEQFARDDNLALLTPVIPNNGVGFHHLLHRFPELAEEYRKLFPHPIVPDCNGPVWIYPQIAEWITRRFLDLRQANRALAERPAPYEKFAFRFSINCLVYDYRHWQQMGGIPNDEEPAWGQWVPDHGKFNVLVTDTLVHHYSFFVQQDWLDRTTLLEDLRRTNLPADRNMGLLRRQGPRLVRFIKQIPRILRRRLHIDANR
jgi:hypothetical protein